MEQIPIPLSKSAPPSTLCSSYSLRLREQRRRSMLQARGHTEYAVYERIVGLDSDGYSDEESDDDYGDTDLQHDMELDHKPGCPNAHSGNVEDVDMDDLGYSDEEANSSATSSTATKKARDLKGKQKASSVSPTTSKQGKERASAAQGRAKKRREERHMSLNARRPVIVLRKDSGFRFSQDSFFPSYMRDQYGLATSPEALASSCPSQGRIPTLADKDTIDDTADFQPGVTDIYVTQEESEAILP